MTKKFDLFEHDEGGAYTAVDSLGGGSVRIEIYSDGMRLAILPREAVERLRDALSAELEAED